MKIERLRIRQNIMTERARARALKRADRQRRRDAEKQARKEKRLADKAARAVARAAKGLKVRKPQGSNTKRRRRVNYKKRASVIKRQDAAMRKRQVRRHAGEKIKHRGKVLGKYHHHTPQSMRSAVARRRSRNRKMRRKNYAKLKARKIMINADVSARMRRRKA